MSYTSKCLLMLVFWIPLVVQKPNLRRCETDPTSPQEHRNVFDSNGVQKNNAAHFSTNWVWRRWNGDEKESNLPKFIAIPKNAGQQWKNPCCWGMLRVYRGLHYRVMWKVRGFFSKLRYVLRKDYPDLFLYIYIHIYSSLPRYFTPFFADRQEEPSLITLQQDFERWKSVLTPGWVQLNTGNEQLDFCKLT